MTYTTIQGDTWDIIALKTMGSEKLMGRLIESNIEYKDVIFFGAGVVLDVPEAEAEYNELLPPWKRGAV